LFHPIFADIGGGVNAGLMLSDLYYWATHNGFEKWHFKTQDDWHRKSRLSRHEQQAAAAKLLARNIIEKQAIGIVIRGSKAIKRVNHYRIIESNFWDALDAVLDDSVSRKSDDRNSVSRKSDDRKSDNRSAENRTTDRERYIGTRARQITNKITNKSYNPTLTAQARQGNAAPASHAKRLTPRQQRIADAMKVFEVQLVMRECDWMADTNLAPIIHEALEQHRRKHAKPIAESALLMVKNWQEFKRCAKYLRHSISPRNWIKRGMWIDFALWPIDQKLIEQDGRRF